MTTSKTTIEYDDAIVRKFTIASIIFGLVGMLAGVYIAIQLPLWQANLGLQWLTFGRLRPLHTNAAIFAFVGNMMFAGIYYSTQRLCKARLASDFLSNLHFWGWQLIIVAAAVTLPLGLTRGKEYAELIWPINIAVALIWVVFAINFFWTLLRRNEPSLYVAIWFYIATIVTVAMLYIVNHLSLPTSFTHSYPIFGGVQDALVQWWYGHNAVAFFLTTPILGLMYYFVPKAAGRPVYSYRLSVVHFWSLIFIYIWAGPHHLLHTALPSWAQSLGMIFSLMLWAPSWGGMLNGLLTLRGAWDKLRTDPVLKFFAAGVTFYGMATFEGPLMAIKSVNMLSHYTDWTIGHVHSGTLGWNGLMAAGMFYYLVPRLWNTKLHSTSLANMHFWLAFLGILIYVVSMWVAGVSQGLMLNGVKPDGTLAYGVFLESVQSIKPMYWLRAVGGFLYLTGFLMLAYNVWMTVRSGKAVNGKTSVLVQEQKQLGLADTFLNAPVVYATLLIFSGCLWGLGAFFTKGNQVIGSIGLFGVIATSLSAFAHMRAKGETWSAWYDKLLENTLPFTILTLLAVGIGGMVQIIPTVILSKAANIEDVRQTPYTPLELAGRDLYVREGCYTCHSQMIRTLSGDILRYGINPLDPESTQTYSRLGESIYDHPFQWGSKRTGPDIARVGPKYDDTWHYRHMRDPRSTSPGSIMPTYAWLYSQTLDVDSLFSRINAQRKLGVPYPALTNDEITRQCAEQADGIVARLKASGQTDATRDSEIIAMIAYLKCLGTNRVAVVPGAAAAPVATPVPATK